MTDDTNNRIEILNGAPRGSVFEYEIGPDGKARSVLRYVRVDHTVNPSGSSAIGPGPPRPGS